MTTIQLLILVISVLSVHAWAVLVYGLPWSMRSCFRYKLWHLRDQIVDDLMGGRLPRTNLVLRFVHRIEIMILRANNVTLVRFMLVPTPSREEFEQWQRERSSELADLSQGERKLFLAYESEFIAIILRRLATASVGGWFMAILVGAVTIVRAIMRQKELVARDIRESVREDSEDAVSRGIRSRERVKALSLITEDGPPRGLSACA